MRAFVCALLLATTQVCASSDQEPWFGRDKQFDWHMHYGYTHFREGDIHRMHTGMALSPFPTISAHVEAAFKNSSDESLTPEMVSLRMRYLMLNDVVGDPVSLSLSTTLRHVFKEALTDRFVLYHSHLEADIDVAIGKEWTKGPDWVFRIWGIGGTRLADRGSPSLFYRVAIDKKLFEKYPVGLFIQGKQALGGRNLDPFKTPMRYSGLKYRNTEAGIECHIPFPIFGKAVIGYSKQIHSRSFAKGGHSFFFRLQKPIHII